MVTIYHHDCAYIRVDNTSLKYFNVLFLKGAMFEKDFERSEIVCTAPSVELN